MQVSGDVSQVEAQLASLQQALLHGKDLLHQQLQDQIAARQQAEQTAQVSNSLMQMPSHTRECSLPGKCFCCMAVSIAVNATGPDCSTSASRTDRPSMMYNS